MLRMSFNCCLMVVCNAVLCCICINSLNMSQNLCLSYNTCEAAVFKSICCSVDFDSLQKFCLVQLAPLVLC